MKMVIPNAGKLLWLSWLVQADSADLPDWDVSLYTNDYTPVDGSVYANFTFPSFTGSGLFVVTRGSMGTPYIDTDIAYSETSTPPYWVNTGGSTETCYGWFMFSHYDNTVLAAQRFENARVMSPGAREDLDPFFMGLKTLD